jgi:hypothetical protein
MSKMRRGCAREKRGEVGEVDTAIVMHCTDLEHTTTGRAGEPSESDARTHDGDWRGRWQRPFATVPGRVPDIFSIGAAQARTGSDADHDGRTTLPGCPGGSRNPRRCPSRCCPCTPMWPSPHSPQLLIRAPVISFYFALLRCGHLDGSKLPPHYISTPVGVQSDHHCKVALCFALRRRDHL